MATKKKTPSADPYADLPEAADPYASLPEASAAPAAAPVTTSTRQSLLARMDANLRNTPDPTPTGGWLHDKLFTPVVHQMNRVATGLAQPAVEMAEDVFAPNSPEAIRNAKEKTDANRQQYDRFMGDGPASKTPVADAVELIGNAAPLLPNAGTQVRNYANSEHPIGDILGDAATAAVLHGVSKGLVKVPTAEVAEGRTGLLAKGKEMARRAGGNVLGKDDSLSRNAVKDAAEKMAQSDADVAAHNKNLEETRTRRRQAAADLEQKTTALRDKTATMQKKAFADNTERWNSLREKVGDDPVEINPVKHVIEETSSHMNPDEVKQFKQILGTQDAGESVEANEDYKNYLAKSRQFGNSYAELPQNLKEHVDRLAEQFQPTSPITDETQPATFSKLQGWYTELGQKMYGGGGQIPGNVYKGLKAVREALGKQVEAVADSKGALPDLQAARQSHQQYQEAFGRQRTQRLSAADQELKNSNPQEFARQQELQRRKAVSVHDPTYNDHASVVDAAHDRLQAFPTEESLKAGIKAPIDSPTVDIGKIAKDEIEKRAGQWKNFNKRDIGMLSQMIVSPIILTGLGHEGFGIASALPVATYEGGSRLLASYAQRPGVAEWFAAPKAGEIEALRKIPGADRVNIINSLTDTAVEASKAGKPVKLAPETASLLGPANVRRILAVSAATSTPKSQPKKRQELLEGAPF